MMTAQHVQRARHIFVRHRLGIHRRRQTLVFRQFKFRGRFHRRRKNQRLAALKLDLFDVRLADHLQLLLVNRLPVVVADQLALGFILDLRGILFYHHVAGCLALAEPRQHGLLLVIFSDGVKGRINGSCVQFHPY